MDNNPLDKVNTQFTDLTKNPEKFLGANDSLSDALKPQIKEIYDLTKRQETKSQSKSGKSLKKLIIKDFDLEQIWQQIELQNDDVMDASIRDLSTLLVSKDKLTFKSLNETVNTKNLNVASSSDNDSEDSAEDFNENKDNSMETGSSDKEPNSESDDDEYEENAKIIKRENHKGSIVDDDFFKLSEMEKFLENEEKPKKEKSKTTTDSESESNEDEEGSVDLFKEEEEDSEDGDDEAKTARFKDYFVEKEEIQPKRKINRLMQELDEENSDESEPEDEEELQKQLNAKLKSTLELRQERLKRKIEELEEQAISEKPWQLKGEITAESRPQNSLLEEVVEFDLTSRPAPIITEQTSLQLEDIIRQRIKHKTFDSVEKINRPIETPLEYKKKLVLDQEKSKESLANIYEKEFLEQQAALDTDKLDAPEEEPQTHKDIKKLMKSLFSKLDALSNFHFTSTPAIPELKIVSNLPAVNMEEVAPVATSDAALLAPEEIRNKSKGDILGKSEKTKTDKKRERRKKKLKQKIHSQRKAKIDSAGSKKNRVKA